MKKKIILIIFLVFVFQNVSAQKFGIKTNIIWDALSTISIGGEYGIAPEWSIDVSGNYNNWTRSHGRRWKHWFIQPEARYWLCEKFQGHFFGAHLHGGQFNISNLDNNIKFLGTDFSKLSDERYQGWFAGLGLGYGYSWILSKHWNFEAEIGVGYSYSRYERYPCAWCGNVIESGKTHHYVGLTKTAINLIYVF